MPSNRNKKQTINHKNPNPIWAQGNLSRLLEDEEREVGILEKISSVMGLVWGFWEVASLVLNILLYKIGLELAAPKCLDREHLDKQFSTVKKQKRDAVALK